jgi:pimeloyl-ACP methyl ester carboxylesterase
LERVKLIGHDWGAFAGFLVALEHPERVEWMVALDITPPWAPRPSVRQLALPLLASYQLLLATPMVGPGHDDHEQRFCQGDDPRRKPAASVDGRGA